MTKVYYTKKHIIVAAVIGVVLLSLLVSFWFFLIAPKRKQVLDYKQQLTSLQQASQLVNQELEQLQLKPDLLESTAVNELPLIPNGSSIEAYFMQLSKLEQNSSVSFLAFNFKDNVLYPQGATPEIAVDKQFRAADISIEFLSDNRADLVKFVGQLEKLDRFLTVQSVDYRTRNGEGETVVSCSASLVVRLYYLSSYETGKALSAE